ncbi:carboxymuconolactone decarboxylase family protein [Loktanella sp. D2R18]|uniref:carboxymuconolactone decarboxylase family protein n=1 Tax=Rhodobacterales TaxID=204455 RepID=UPI000DE9E153|nr:MULTISPECIES: carboxymuconolactone decarboxylase family protein [Rhodobacterales]MDO6591553.1 carboxymuconolactone decarboxylase family protein [Yoonia sp. 1_MG-2023]RBW43819.1 carboxymuconolactone decarboxylase family protein [Loktanella sp. D2R18]
MTTTALEKGRAHVAQMNPTLEETLAARYDHLVPGMAESLVEWAYGRHYVREGLDVKTRQLCTVAALTAMGGQTTPQLKINIAHALSVGVTEKEMAEVIWQMSVYGGMPAAINGLNALLEVQAEQ